MIKKETPVLVESSALVAEKMSKIGAHKKGLRRNQKKRRIGGCDFCNDAISETNAGNYTRSQQISVKGQILEKHFRFLFINSRKLTLKFKFSASLKWSCCGKCSVSPRWAFLNNIIILKNII